MSTTEEKAKVRELTLAELEAVAGGLKWTSNIQLKRPEGSYGFTSGWWGTDEAGGETA